MSSEGEAKLALLRATDAQAMAMANSFVLRALLDALVELGAKTNNEELQFIDQTVREKAILALSDYAEDRGDEQKQLAGLAHQHIKRYW